jgi:hypothetical protein
MGGLWHGGLKTERYPLGSIPSRSSSRLRCYLHTRDESSPKARQTKAREGGENDPTSELCNTFT